MRLIIRNLIFSVLWLSATAALGQAPVITSFTPTSGIPGITVTINGTNFDVTPGNNFVLFGSAKATVTSATATQLTVTVPAGALNQPISVLNLTTGLSAVSSRQFLPVFTNCGSTTISNFAAKVEFQNGSVNVGYPDIATADMDGDGRADIITGGSEYFAIHRNLSTPGSPSFTVSVSWTTNSTYLTGLATGDLTGDGKPEVITTNPTTDQLVIRRNASTPGSLSFGSVLEFPTDAASDNNASIGDIDGDGKNDVVILSTAPAVLIFRNTTTAGVISFAPVVTYSVGASTDIHNTKLADFDGDGKLDIAVDGNSLFVFRNLSTPGLISLSAKQTFTTVANCRGLSITDLDNDGKSDVTVANSTANSISVFRNTSTAGSISLAIRTDYATTSNPNNVSTGDIDGDSKPDLAVLAGSILSVFKNLSTPGSISIGSSLDFTTGGTQSGLIGDFDYDNQPDMMAVTHNFSNIGFFKNITSCIPPSITSFSPISGPIGTTVTLTGTNFNTTTTNNVVFFGAVRATVVTATPTQLTVTVPAGTERDRISVTDIITGLTAYSVMPFQQSFICGSPFSTSSLTADLNLSATASSIKIKDIDGDGKPDIAAKKTSTIEIHRNSTATSVTFNPAHVLSTSGAGAIFTEDINGDGKPDLINHTTQTISIHKNSSTPGLLSFTPRVDYTLTAGDFVLDIHDLDGDGKADIIACDDFLNDDFRILRNTSSQNVVSFQNVLTLPLTSYLRIVRVIDMNGDSKPDLLIPRETYVFGDIQKIAYYKNTTVPGGPITFVAENNILTEVNVSLVNMIAGDVDGDGKPDILYAGQNTPKLSVLRNTTTGGVLSFATRVDFTASGYNQGPVLTDLDGDSKPEVAMLVYAGSGFMVFKNNSMPGTISFAPYVNIGTGSNPSGLAAGDFNTDGKTDLLVTVSSTFRVLKNTTSYTAPAVNVSPPYSYLCQGSVSLTAFGASTYTWSPAYGLSATSGATVSANPTVATTYTVTGTTAAGCVGTNTVTVGVGVRPTVTTQDKSICSEASTNLTLTTTPGPSTYSWTVHSVTSNVTGTTVGTTGTSSTINHTLVNSSSTVNGTVIYRVLATYGYCSGDYKDVTVTVKAKISTPYITMTGSMCNGYVTLSSSGGSSYEWSTSNTLQTVDILSPGTYWVTVTYANGCSKTSGSVIVQPCNGDPPCEDDPQGRRDPCIEDPMITIEEDVIVKHTATYPNPAREVLTVQLPVRTDTDLLVELYSPYSQVVRTTHIEKDSYKITIDTQSLTRGVYLVKVVFPRGKVFSRKVLISN